MRHIPSLKSFIYLLGFNTAHFSRERRRLFLNGTLKSDDAEELGQQSLKSVRSEGDATLDNDTKSDVARYEKRLELFDIYADSRLSQDAFDPNVAPKWIFNKRVAEVFPSCSFFEFLRLFQVGKGRNKPLLWRSQPVILIIRPVLQLRVGGSRMHMDSKYALLLFQPNATRSAINAMDGVAATNALVAFASASDELQRYAYLRNLLVHLLTLPCNV